VTFPIFLWQHEGVSYVLDGHQRDQALKSLAQEGWEIPPLPAALIEAKSKKEAAEKILLISSQYGKMSNQSLEEFLADNDLDLSDLEEELELPSIDLEFFREPDFQPTSAEQQGRLDRKNRITCPSCGHEFTP
jgi:hypothetical protein